MPTTPRLGTYWLLWLLEVMYISPSLSFCLSFPTVIRKTTHKETPKCTECFKAQRSTLYGPQRTSTVLDLKGHLWPYLFVFVLFAPPPFPNSPTTSLPLSSPCGLQCFCASLVTASSSPANLSPSLPFCHHLTGQTEILDWELGSRESNWNPHQGRRVMRWEGIRETQREVMKTVSW